MSSKRGKSFKLLVFPYESISTAVIQSLSFSTRTHQVQIRFPHSGAGMSTETTRNSRACLRRMDRCLVSTAVPASSSGWCMKVKARQIYIPPLHDHRLGFNLPVRAWGSHPTPQPPVRRLWRTFRRRSPEDWPVNQGGKFSSVAGIRTRLSGRDAAPTY